MRVMAWLTPAAAGLEKREKNLEATEKDCGGGGDGGSDGGWGWQAKEGKGGISCGGCGDGRWW